MRVTIFILVISLMLYTGCDKNNNDDTGGQGIPFQYSLYFEIIKQDGNSFQEGEIEARWAYLNEEGQITNLGDWGDFNIDIYASDTSGKTLFGPFGLGIGTEPGEEPEDGTEWVTNNLLLLRYQGITEVDTLRSRDSARYPEYRYFDIYKNDIHMQRFNDPENNIEYPWHISIIK